MRKGFDPRDFALVAEGGAGPAFAAAIAVEVGTPAVIVPPLPGRHRGASACSPPTPCTSTWPPPTSGCRSSNADELRGALRRSSRRRRSDQLAAGRHRGGPDASSSASPTAATSARATSCASSVRSGAIDDAWVAKVTADFHDAHEREYSRRFEGSDIEIPNIRVRGVGLMPPLEMPEIEQGETIAPDARCATSATAWFQVDGELRELADPVLRPRGAARRATGSRARRSSTSTTRPRWCRRAWSARSTASGTS